MNPKSVAIIAVVAVVVAVISFGTFLMDSGDDLELREYLVEGDWVEYYDEGEDSTTRYTVLSVEEIDSYKFNISDEMTITAPYSYIFTVVGPDDGDVEYLRSETVDTFLGETDCDVYGLVSYGSQVIYYVEPATGLALVTELKGSGRRLAIRSFISTSGEQTRRQRSITFSSRMLKLPASSPFSSNTYSPGSRIKADAASS